MTFCGLGQNRFGWAILASGLLLGCEFKSSASHTTSNTTLAPDSGSVASKPAESNEQSASETIGIEGSSTVYPICQAFAVEFERKSHHKVSVGRQGTGGGYKKFVNRQADIWNASRPIAAKEKEELSAKQIGWLELTIAVDGIVLVVNPQNTWCSSLTCAQLKRIWEPDSQVHNWSDLDPAWPAEPILLYGADTDSGTFEYFTEVINGKKNASNTNYTPASDDNILVTGVATNKNALGYIPFGYYIENTEKLKVIGISPTKDAAEAAAPVVSPTEETILSGEYAPLSRPLYMYANTSSLQSRKEVAEFLAYAVSEEAQTLIKDRGFVPVKDDVRQQMQKKLAESLVEQPAQSN